MTILFKSDEVVVVTSKDAALSHLDLGLTPRDEEVRRAIDDAVTTQSVMIATVTRRNGEGYALIVDCRVASRL